MVSLFTMMVPMAMLGFFIFAVPHLAYPYYAHVERPFGPGGADRPAPRRHPDVVDIHGAGGGLARGRGIPLGSKTRSDVPAVANTSPSRLTPEARA